MIIPAWFWCVYVDIYIIFCRRVRKAIQLLAADLMEMTGVGCDSCSKDQEEETDVWWSEMNNL